MKAIIVGGGIGGLMAAVALQKAGLRVVVLERARKLHTVGAGIALWANATKVLRSLDLYDAVLDAGAEIGGEARTRQGRKLLSFSAEELRHRFGSANLAIHRADLQLALYAALPEDTVRLGSELVDFGHEEKGIVARFSDGREERGDFLVGADGLRSVVRAKILGDGPPRYAGFTAWRGIAEDHGEKIVPEKLGLNVWGRGTEFGLTRIGRGRIYWYATANAPENMPGMPDGPKEEVLELLRGYYEPARAAVEATREESILRTDLYDREPARRWGVGRVTLLGDAAHPMTPSLGQGACQAIEDAAVLADVWRSADSVTAGLRRYEDRRIGRTSSVVRRSRRMGRAMQNENYLVCGLRDAVAGKMPPGVRLRLLEPVVGYEVR